MSGVRVLVDCVHAMVTLLKKVINHKEIILYGAGRENDQPDLIKTNN